MISLLFPKTDMRLPALHVADSHDLIRVQGARENNLEDVSIARNWTSTLAGRAVAQPVVTSVW